MTAAADSVRDALARELLREFPDAAARELERRPASEIASVLGAVEPAGAAVVLRRLSRSVAREAFAALDAPAAGQIAGALQGPAAAVLVRGWAPERLDALLGAMPDRARRAIRRPLSYLAGAVGAFADSEAPAYAPDVTVSFVLEQLRAHRGGNRDCVFAVDRDGHLVGAANLADLVVAPADVSLGSVVGEDVVALQDVDAAASLAGHEGWSSWRALAVNDREGRFVGAVGFDTVQQLLPDAHRPQGSGLSLPASLAELFWLGLAGVTDGLGRAALGPGSSRDR